MISYENKDPGTLKQLVLLRMPWKMDRRGWQLPLPNVSPSPWDPGRMGKLSPGRPRPRPSPEAPEACASAKAGGAQGSAGHQPGFFHTEKKPAMM